MQSPLRIRTAAQSLIVRLDCAYLRGDHGGKVARAWQQQRATDPVTPPYPSAPWTQGLPLFDGSAALIAARLACLALRWEVPLITLEPERAAPAVDSITPEALAAAWHIGRQSVHELQRLVLRAYPQLLWMVAEGQRNLGHCVEQIADEERQTQRQQRAAQRDAWYAATGFAGLVRFFLTQLPHHPEYHGWWVTEMWSDLTDDAKARLGRLVDTYRAEQTRAYWQSSQEGSQRYQQTVDDILGMFGRQPTPTAALAALGLTSICTEADVKRAYKQRATTCHPDRGGSNEQFHALTKHYEAVLAWVHQRSGHPASV